MRGREDSPIGEVYKVGLAPDLKFKALDRRRTRNIQRGRPRLPQKEADPDHGCVLIDLLAAGLTQEPVAVAHDGARAETLSGQSRRERLVLPVGKDL